MKTNRKKESGIIEVPLLIVLGLVSIAGVFYGGIKFSENRQKNKAAVNEVIVSTISPILSPTFAPVFKKPVITLIPTVTPKIKSQIKNEKPITIVPTKANISTANWSSYQNGALDFKFNFPKDWFFSSRSNQNNIILTDGEGGPWILDFSIENTTKNIDNNVSLKIDELRKILDNPQISVSNIKLSGIDARKITVFSEGGMSVHNLVVHNGILYTFVFRSESDIENQILNSFQVSQAYNPKFVLINDNYKLISETSNKLTIQGPGYSGNVDNITLDFYKFKKPAEQKMEDWITQNKSKLPIATTFEGECLELGSSETVLLSMCGRWAEEDFIVNKNGDSFLYLFQGQDPPLTASDLLKLISFR